MSNRVHPGDDEIQAALDGRLEPQQLIALEQHLGACEPCRATRDALSWVRASFRASGPPELPRNLDRSVRRALATAPAGTARPRRALIGLVAAAALAASGLLWRRWRRRDLAGLLAADYVAYRDGRLTLTLRTGDAQELERRFRAASLGFPARVLDLAMMEQALAGGRVHDLGGRPSALFSYRDAQGRPLVCQMFEGQPEELGPPQSYHERNGIAFFVHRRGTVTVVAWPEAGVVCALAAEGTPEGVLALAVAKAMRAT
jgi:anti-sigma factor RsiW